MALTLDENSGALATVLRQAEVAGHEPLDVLTAAITERKLGNARSIASVCTIGSRTAWTSNRRAAVTLIGRRRSPTRHTKRTLTTCSHGDRRRDELGEMAVIEDQRGR